eukprot:TCALIF_13702-PA protein Name:"Protein of unknown function" AED:0.41 eAED:0.41 QI:0/0/0/0.66/1/0.33/3/0/853
MQITEQRETSIQEQIKSQESEPIQRRTSIMKKGEALPEKDDNKEGTQKEDIEKAIENPRKSKEGIEEEKVKSEGKNKKKTEGNTQFLAQFFKYREISRRAKYLREHLLLAIDLGMSEEALMFLQFSEELFLRCKEHWQQIIVNSHQADLVASPNHPDHSKTTPLLESIKKKNDEVTQKLIDLERDLFMQASDSPTNEEVRAHHASNTTYPDQLKHCLGPENPSDQILRHYFHYLVQSKPLAKRMAALNQSEKVTILELHRQWAVQVFNHSALHEVTNAIATLTIEEKKRIVCSHGNLLQSAVSTQKRWLVIGELLHQEYLCHKKDEDEQEGKKECILCIQKQLTHDYDISYAIDTLDSFFPKTNVAKWCNFIFFHLVFVLLGASLILLDIYLDMQLTEDFYNRTLIATNETDQTKFELAFQISWGSQLLPLITSIPIWIWKLTELKQFSSQCTRRVSSTTQKEDIEMTPLQPNKETQLMKVDSTATSNKEQTLTSKWKTTIEVLSLALPPLVACLAFTVCILLKKKTLKLGIICASNFFTGAVILCLSLERLINRCHFIFSQDHRKSTLRNQFQVIERQHALATIGESCLEAIVQLSLQLWLLSQEDFASDFDKGFIMNAVRTLSSVTSLWKHDPFRNQLIFKLFMSCLSLIFSVCKSYRLLKNQSMRIYHLSFVFLSLNLQLWARMSVIFAWCMYMNCSPELTVGGVGIFLGLNILLAGMVRVANVDHNAEKTPLTYQNILVYFLEIMASSMVLVRIPKAKQDNEIVSENTLALQSWYFFLSFVTNIVWVIIIQCCAKISLCETLGEIILLFLMASLFQILYYTVFGHPWRYISQIKIKNMISKVRYFKTRG